MEEAKKPKVESSDFKITFGQDNDCMESSNGGQFLSIRNENGGGGDFFIIETSRWAFESIAEITELLKIYEEKYKKLTK